MTNSRILGIVLLAVGLLLLGLGYNASQSIGEQAVETFTGRFTDKTTWLFIVGVASTVAGIGFLAFGGKK